MLDKIKIREYYPDAENLMIEPMLIHSATDEKLKEACESEEYFGQLKKDGAFYQFVKGEAGNCFLFGRTISKKTGILTEKINNVPHIKNALNCLPNGTVLVGEIYYPGRSSRNTTEIMGCLPDKAISRMEQKGLIHYYIYDILVFNNINLIELNVTNESRYIILQTMFKEFNLGGNDFIELAESWTDNLYNRVSLALDSGEEGMVIKKKTGRYRPGKRPSYNLKAKKMDSTDVIIIGFEEPTKKYYGKEIESWQYWMNENTHDFLPIDCHYNEENVIPVTKACYMNWHNSRIKIGAYNSIGEIEEIGTISSGISDEMKKDMTNNPDKYLNHVAKIQMMEKDKVGHTFRHGFFLSLREDKPLQDCTIESIF